MKIDVAKLRQEVARLNKLEEGYENIYLTYYNIIQDVENEWNNQYEIRLMQNVNDEKKQMNMVYNDLKDINSLYSYICGKYSFCNRANINLDKEDLIIRKLDNCIYRIRKIRTLCYNVSTKNMDGYKKSILNDVKYRTGQELEKMLVLREKLRSTFSKIREIENDIRAKKTKVVLSTIKETDISNCVEP